MEQRFLKTLKIIESLKIKNFETKEPRNQDTKNPRTLNIPIPTPAPDHPLWGTGDTSSRGCCFLFVSNG